MNIEPIENFDHTNKTVLEKIQKQIVFQEQILQELDLDGVKIPEISLQVKEKIETFKLYTLTMNGCGLTNLNNLPKILNLARLELSQNNFDPDELQKIPANYPHLTTLMLQENQIQNLKQIHFLTSLKNLFQLDLSGTPLSREPDYRNKIFKLLPQIDVLDGLDKNGCPFEFADDEIEVVEEKDDDDDDADDSNQEQEENNTGNEIDEEDDDSDDAQ